MRELEQLPTTPTPRKESRPATPTASSAPRSLATKLSPVPVPDCSWRDICGLPRNRDLPWAGEDFQRLPSLSPADWVDPRWLKYLSKVQADKSLLYSGFDKQFTNSKDFPSRLYDEYQKCNDAHEDFPYPAFFIYRIAREEVSNMFFRQVSST